MANIERYSEIAQGANASIYMDSATQDLVVKAPRRSLLGRIAHHLNSMRASVKAQNRATWQDFADSLKSHYKDDASIAPVIRELEIHSARKKPLTIMHVKSSLKQAEQLMQFKNEQVISSVLNTPAEPGADRPPRLAETSSDFLRNAMDDVYYGMAGKISDSDPNIYRANSSKWASHIIARVKQLKAEQGEPCLTRSQVEQAIKEAAQDIVGFGVVTQEQVATTSRYTVDKGLPASAKGNKIFLELAKEHGLPIELQKLSPTMQDELKRDVSKACVDVYTELRTNRGAAEAVTEADVEAAIKARWSRSLQKSYLPTVDQIRRLDIDAHSRDKLIDYVCHTSRAAVENFELIKKVFDQQPQLASFYKTLPQRLHAVDQSRADAVQNQMAKTKLYTTILEHGNMLGDQWAELAEACEKQGKEIGPDDRESFYTMAADLPALLFLTDEEADQLNQACASAAMHEAVANMRSADYLISSAGADMQNVGQDRDRMQQMREEFSRGSHAALVVFFRKLEASPYNEGGAEQLPQSSSMAESFSELDNGVVSALHESGFSLPFLDRSNQSGSAAIPPALHADMEKSLQSHMKFGTSDLAYDENGIAKSFITTFGRANFTLTAADGQTVELPRNISGSFKERSQVILPAIRSFCYQHQRDAWMKEHQGVANEQEIQKLADNELKLIAQLANANLWADFGARTSQGGLPYHGAIVGGQSAHTDYRITAEADGGFRCDSTVIQKGGFLAPQADFDPTDINNLLSLDAEESYTKADLSVLARPEDFAAGNDSTSVPQLATPIGYEYNLKLAATAS